MFGLHYTLVNFVMTGKFDVISVLIIMQRIEWEITNVGLRYYYVS